MPMSGRRAALTALFIAGSLSGAEILPSHSPARAAATGQAVVYLIPGLSGGAFYQTMELGARGAARHLGIRLLYQGSPYAFSPSAQIPYLDAAIAQHPAAIIVAPTDRRALNEPISRAVRAGIPVITVDTSITAPLAVTTISSNNVHGGALAATALARTVHFKGTVAALSTEPGISTADQRQQGFARQLRRYGHIRYLGVRYDQDNVTTATEVTARLLREYPHLSGIAALNAVSGDGALAALQSSHRPSGVHLVEFDADPLEVQALRQGVVAALIAQDPFTMGSTAVHLARRWITGRRHGIKKHYRTRTVVLTRSNLGTPGLRRFLYSGG
jgi:ribose transport system substrate-binding protein